MGHGPHCQKFRIRNPRTESNFSQVSLSIPSLQEGETLLILKLRSARSPGTDFRPFVVDLMIISILSTFLTAFSLASIPFFSCFVRQSYRKSDQHTLPQMILPFLLQNCQGKCRSSNIIGSAKLKMLLQ